MSITACKDNKKLRKKNERMTFFIQQHQLGIKKSYFAGENRSTIWPVHFFFVLLQA